MQDAKFESRLCSTSVSACHRIDVDARLTCAYLLHRLLKRTLARTSPRKLALARLQM